MLQKLLDEEKDYKIIKFLTSYMDNWVRCFYVIGLKCGYTIGLKCGYTKESV